MSTSSGDPRPNRPAGILPGHTEGITHVASKGRVSHGLMTGIVHTTAVCCCLCFLLRLVTNMVLSLSICCIGLVVIDFSVLRSGDGVYVLSNGKDQTAKLWDLRKMMAGRVDCRSLVNRQTSNWDYRFMAYPVCLNWDALLSSVVKY